MNLRLNILSLSLVLLSGTLLSQTLSKPKCTADQYFFSDSTRIEITHANEEGTIVLEIGNGQSTFFREYNGPFYVDQTKTVSCKVTHPDYNDSRLAVVKVYKNSESNLSVRSKNASSILFDKQKGNDELLESEWVYVNANKVEFQLVCEDRKLEEIELLSYVDTKKAIIPPKKVVLHAHLKNGKIVHVRTANTVGTFKKTAQNWSHVVRLSGKPKLKKILKKTEYFTLTAYAQKKNDAPQTMVFDEILAR